MVGQAEGQEARTLADLSLNAYRRGRAGEAREDATRALESAEAARDTEALAQAHNILGILAGAAGETAVAREHLERSLALAEGLADPSARVAAMNNLALAVARGGDGDRALEMAREALALCSSQGDRHREARETNPEIWKLVEW